MPASLPEAFYAPLSPFYTRPVDDQLNIREFPREHPHREEKAICVTVQKRTAKSYGRERWAWRSCSSFLALLLEATTHCISDDSSRFFHALAIWKECNSFVVDSNSAIPQLWKVPKSAVLQVCSLFWETYKIHKRTPTHTQSKLPHCMKHQPRKWSISYNIPQFMNSDVQFCRITHTHTLSLSTTCTEWKN